MWNLLLEIFIAFLIGFKKGKTPAIVVIAVTVIVLTLAVVTIVSKSDLSM